MALKLPLYGIEFEARDAIIKAIEPQLRPQLRGMTWTAWRARYGKVCLDMAMAGVTPMEAKRAWEACCDEWGKVVFSMRVVQEWIVGHASEPEIKRYHAVQDDNEGIRPLSEIIAEQKKQGVYSGSIRKPRTA